jgi:hypothetical protein
MTSTTTERLRDAATALGSTVTPADLPPLHLSDSVPAARARRRPRGARRWLIPVATAAAVAAIIGLIVVARGLPGQGRLHQQTLPVSPGQARLVRWPGGPAGWDGWRIVSSSSSAMIITAMAASSQRHAWAFGSPSAHQPPAAWQLTGSSWHQVAFPARKGQQIAAAASSSRTDGWAFAQRRAWHWNGHSWKAVSGFTGGVVFGATDRGPGDVWVFGQAAGSDSGSYVTWHYDGRSWSQVPAAAGLSTVLFASGRDFWAAGFGNVGHWTPGGWTVVSLARQLPRRTRDCAPRLTSLYARSDTDAWALGFQNCQGTGGAADLLHYNGHTWRRVTALGQHAPSLLLPDGQGGVLIGLNPDPQSRAPSTLLRYDHGHLTPVHRSRLRALASSWQSVFLPRAGTIFAAGAQPPSGATERGFILRGPA